MSTCNICCQHLGAEQAIGASGTAARASRLVNRKGIDHRFVSRTRHRKFMACAFHLSRKWLSVSIVKVLRCRHLSTSTSLPAPFGTDKTHKAVKMSDPRHAPKLLQRIDELRSRRENCKSVGLVPTMGALHEGHLSLCKTAARENDLVIMSLYVNPTQFGKGEDLESYPRTLEDDMEKIRKLNEELSAECKGDRLRDSKPTVGYVFAPNSRSMYPNHPPSSEPNAPGTFLNVRPLSSILEGRTRPHFFHGVATVVAKLLNIVQPTRVYFGQKDAQQCAVIAQMVDDLHFNTDMRVLPTVREHDGLAMSSRNKYLGGAESDRRQAATVLYDRLMTYKSRYENGAVTRREILGDDADSASYTEKTFRSGRVPWMLDYISLADQFTMQEVEERVDDRGAIVSAALWMLPFEEGLSEHEKRKAVDGPKDDQEDPMRVVRLIDNIILPPRTAKKRYANS